MSARNCPTVVIGMWFGMAATHFYPNYTIGDGVVTSDRSTEVAVTASQICLRFPFWWCIVFNKKNYLRTKFTKIAQSTADTLVFLVSESKRPSYWNSTSGSTSTFPPSSACDSASAYQISFKSDHPRPSYDVIAIFNMATTASQIYFRFPPYQRIAVKNVKIYLHTKLRQRSWIRGRNITISGIWKQTADILKFYFDVSYLIGMWFYDIIPNFIQIGPSAAELWHHSDFQDGGRQPCWICCGVMVDHPRSVVDSCCYVLKFWLDRICSFWDRPSTIFRFSRFGLKLPIHAHV